MTLSARQRGALAAICDTFAPGSADRGAPAGMLEAVAANPRKAERAQVRTLLSLFALLGFPGKQRDRREAVLRAWCDSRISQRRAAFLALRKGVLHMDSASLYETVNYPGPLGAPQPPPRRTIAPLAVDSDTTLECDVCVVGSGAGGGTAAAVLASSGLDVVVVEAGGHYEDADFDGAERNAWRNLYAQGGAAATVDQGVGLLAGECLGGSTIVNYTTSFQTPDEVRAEWARHGVPAFATDTFTRSLEVVCARLGINVDHNRLSARDAIFKRGLETLGWHCGVMPRNVLGCDQDGPECGWCGFGCRRGAKQSTLKTWLADADAAGARILVRTRARRILVRVGAVCGVEALTGDGHRVAIRSRAVVVAAGAIQTPALLRRSGLGNRQIGRNLRLHPVTGVFGLFDEEVRPWEGTLQAVYSDQHRDLDGAGYGVKYETAPIHPTLFAAFAPWRSAEQYRDLASGLGRYGVVGVLLRDSSSGEVRVGRDGEPIVRYALNEKDRRHVRAGIDGAAQILEAAGAHRIMSAQSRFVSAERREDLLSAADTAGYQPGRCVYYSFHLMGSARMGGSASSSACGPEGETWDVRNLVLCDGSTFPTASGVNPMVTIEAIAHMNAAALAARL
jgi:long-chain-alcohol oxidase